MLKKICILRLSAIGDVVNCLPSLRAIQKTYPKAIVTWIIGAVEYEIVKDIPEVNFIVIDKRHFWQSWFKLRKLPKFDVVLHMQVSFRASLYKTALKSPSVIGFDKARRKDLQNWFCNEFIAPNPNAHFLKNYLDFAKTIGADTQQLQWHLPIDKILIEANSIKLPEQYAIISPCSSKKIRNLPPEKYNEIAQKIFETYQLPCVLTGGKSTTELLYKTKINTPSAINLIGETTLRQTVALIKNAKFIICPDSGPAHIATATSTPVIGLYANTDPKRAAPYLNQELVVSAYPQAVEKYLKNQPVKFGTRVNHHNVMDLIKVSSVLKMVETLMKRN